MSHIAERRISRPMTTLRIGFATLAAPAVLFFGARAAGAEVPTSQVTVPTISSTAPNGIRDHVAITPTTIRSGEKSSDGTDPLLPLAIGTGAVLLLIATFPFSDGEGPPRESKRERRARLTEDRGSSEDAMIHELLRPGFRATMPPEEWNSLYQDLTGGEPPPKEL